MSTIDQLIARIDTAKNYLENSFTTDILTESVMDMTAQIVGRVQQTGKLASGNIKRYSTRTTLVGASSFRNPSTFEKLLTKSTGKLKGKTKDNGKVGVSGYKWVTVQGGDKMVHLVVLPGGYKKIRDLDGLQSEFKDFKRSGVMWRNTGLIPGKTTKQKVFIGGKTTEAQKLLNVNSWREKENILMPMEQEVMDQAQFIKRQLAIYLNKTLLGQ